MYKYIDYLHFANKDHRLKSWLHSVTQPWLKYNNIIDGLKSGF